MGESCERYAREVLSESGSRAVEDLRIVARMRSGYFVISARLREAAAPSRISDLGSVEKSKRGVVIKIDPSKEANLPAVLSTLGSKYAEDDVSVASRFEIEVAGADVDGVSRLVVIDREREMTDEVTSILASIAPEGFRVSRTWRSEGAVTILASQHSLKKSWIDAAERIQTSWETTD